MAAAPKLRDDLVIRQQLTASGTAVVVKDPATRRFFRIGDVEHFVAQQLDGATSLDVVRARVQERFGKPLSDDTLQRFVDQFGRHGLLDDTRERRFAESKRQWLRGSPLYIRVKAFDPDRFLNWLVTRSAFVFTRPFVILSAATLLLALAVAFVGWPEVARDLRRLYRFDALLLAWMTIVSVTIIHELAHGVTCKRFGGEVNEIGFMLLYFQPAFYCNVSDAWLIPEKSKRLWVSAAGAYVEMLIWALATLVWRITERDTVVNFVALIIMATSGVKTLFNLNPLIKLDGYYFLSDYLDIPNLRQKSTTMLKARVRGLWPPSASALRVHGREDAICLGYGLLAVLYSTTFIALIIWRFGSFLTTQYQGAGFIASAALLMAAFQRPLRRVTSATVATLRPAPQSSVWRRLPVRAMVAVVLLAALAVVPVPLRVSGDFRILPGHNADVRAQVDGIITEVLKDEGDPVAKGDLIVRLDDRDYRAQLEQTDARILEKSARLELLETGPRQEELALARTELEAARVRRLNGEQMYEEAARLREADLARNQASVDKASQRLQFARNELTRLRTLFDASLVSRQAVDESEELVTVRQKELEEAQGAAKMVATGDLSEAKRERDLTTQELDRAQGQLRVLMAGSRPEEIKATAAEISSLEAQRAYLREQLRLVEVASPASGVIATVKLKQRVGERISRGDLVAKVYEQSTVTAEVMVSEKEIADVQVGQNVVLKARAFPDRSFPSRVTAIAPIAIDDSNGLGGRAIRVMAEIDNRSGVLKAEMTGRAKITAGRRRLADVALRRLSRYVRVEFWSWW